MDPLVFNDNIFDRIKNDAVYWLDCDKRRYKNDYYAKFTNGRYTCLVKQYRSYDDKYIDQYKMITLQNIKNAVKMLGEYMIPRITNSTDYYDVSQYTVGIAYMADQLPIDIIKKSIHFKQISFNLAAKYYDKFWYNYKNPVKPQIYKIDSIKYDLIIFFNV
jgi:hypothetical protein